MEPTRAELTGLPAVPSRAILSLLPLHQLIVTLPRVHPHFAPIAASVLRRARRLVLHLGDQNGVIAMQKAACPLKLPLAGHLVGEPDSGAPLYGDTTHLSEHYRLRLAGPFDDGTVEQLTRRMPSIVHLEVIIANDSRGALLLPPLSRLLTHWAPTLRTLTLRIGTFVSSSAWSISLYNSLLASQLPSLRLLVDTINHTLTSLETLTLAVPNLFVRWDDGVTPLGPLPLPVLSRLREFNFSVGHGSPEVVTFLLEALEKYAGDQLTSIGIPGLGSGPGEFARLARSRFACRFTQVGVPSPYPENTVPLLSRAFPNLTAFSLQCPVIQFPPPHQFISRLRDLSHLGHLTFLSFWYFTVDLLLPGSTYAPVLALASVKVLQLHFWSRERDTRKGHDRLEGPSWGTLFPGVQIVKIMPTGRFCGTCYPAGQEASNPFRCGANYAQGTSCLTQLLAPLKALPSLRQIFYLPEGQWNHIAEFTPAGSFVRTHEYTK